LYAFVKAHTLLAHGKFLWKKEISRYLIVEVLAILDKILLVKNKQKIIQS